MTYQTLRIFSVAAMVLGLATGLVAQRTDSAAALLRVAMDRETVDGDLSGAIKQYQFIVDTHASDRALVAQALVRMAECYQKLGDAESKKIYERIVREFADQTEAVAMARSGLGRSVTAQSDRVVARQVWTLGSGCCDVFGTVSPDGRYIPYIAYDMRASDLFLHDLTTGANRRLTNLSPADRATSTVPGMGEIGVSLTGAYSFSRDGKQLAYSWLNFKSQRHEIRVIGLQGSGVPAFRRLFDKEDIEWIGPHDWSPDGKWIAVALQRKDRSAQIGLVSTEDGSLRVLKSVDWRGPSHMFFAPDGKHLAFDFQRDVFILAIDGSREIPAVVHPSDEAVIGWSPDGTHLLFASDRAGSNGLWALRFADGEVQGPPDLIKRDIGQFMESMGVTTSGTLYSIIYPGRTQNASRSFDILQATFDFGQGKFLTPPVPAVQTFIGTNRQPNWSPDGKYLAYLSRNLVVGIRSVATGEVRELSLWQSMSYVFGFSWASDSRFFILAATDAKGRNGIFRIDAQSGQTALVVQSEDNGRGLGQAAESPDGRFLYYRRAVKAPGELLATSQIFVKRDLASGNEREIIRRNNLGALMLSPDGRFIATGSIDASGTQTFLLIPTSGGEPRELMQGERPGSIQMWAPDSQSVFIRKGSELWRAPLDGGQPSKLDVTMDPAMGPFFAVHPDGRQIAIQMNGPNKPAEIWVLENFLPAVNAKR